MLNQNFKTMVTNSVIGIIAMVMMSACASTTFEAHEDRTKNSQISYLLGEAPLNAEEQSRLIENYLSMAKLSLQNGRSAKAKRAGEKILKLDPNNYQGRLILADYHLSTGGYTEALSRFQTLYAEAPTAQAMQGYGLVLLMQGKTEDGRTHIKQALGMDQSLWRAWNGLAVSYDLDENWTEAENAYAKALEHNSDSAEVKNNMGLSFINQGRLDDALETLKSAIELPNGQHIADKNYRWAQALSGNFDSAIIGLSDKGKAELFNNLGRSALMKNEVNDAIDYFKRALSIHPSHFAIAKENLDKALDQASL